MGEPINKPELPGRSLITSATNKTLGFKTTGRLGRNLPSGVWFWGSRAIRSDSLSFAGDASSIQGALPFSLFLVPIPLVLAV